MPAHHSAPGATATPSLTTTCFGLLAARRPAVHQDRTFVRLVQLSLASVLALGRHTLTQLLVALGVAGRGDWSAWYRLFNRERIAVGALQDHLLAQAVATIPTEVPAIVAAVDGTQLPRRSRRFPGVGLTVCPRSPQWQRGFHLAQRFVGLSLLLPRSLLGDSRALPLKWLLLRTAKTTPLGDEPERTERAGALALIQ
jgi:hypothetical protein